jgi:hypothetical protein
LTSSDERIKSDFKPITPELMNTIGRLPIQSYYKHLDGRVADDANAERLMPMRQRVAAIDAMGESEMTAAVRAERSVLLSDINRYDAEDWLAVKGPQIPGRLAGVIAQDVEKLAPEYVTKAGRPFANGPDLEPIRTINDPAILYIMVETLRHDMAKLSAEFAAYRATHP